MLIRADTDDLARLFTLGEKQRGPPLATDEIPTVIAQNSIFYAPNDPVFQRSTTVVGRAVEIVPERHATVGARPGRVPLYLEGEEVQTELMGEQTVRLQLSAEGAFAYCNHGCASLTSDMCIRR